MEFILTVGGWPKRHNHGEVSVYQPWMKNGDISTKHPNYNSDISTLNNLKNRADSIISKYYEENGQNPQPEYVKAELDKPDEIKQKSYEGIIDYIKELKGLRPLLVF